MEFATLNYKHKIIDTFNIENCMSVTEIKGVGGEGATLTAAQGSKLLKTS